MTNLTGSFDTVLIANRGEIALRVMRSAKAAGLRTVAVFSDADADAPHVAFADAAVHLGPAPARDSYLVIDKVIEAARQSGAGAIHPGYGFLSENADFARACADAGIVFVGPTPEAIDLMGDKAAAKRRMADAGVPLLPGYQGEEQDDARLLSEAEAVGYPMMVKAAAGGGGKGMRLVTDAAGLPDAIAAARREALSAFGSDVLILERALLRPRHVEVQVLADAHGHVIAVGERDCSVQRRHQKVVEEAPAPDLDDTTRKAMHDAAVEAARSIAYVGAGTVEFLLGTGDDAGTFAFLEMNTRLQVEHPVTEMTTGIDLVDWQLRIAAGAPLTIAQDDVRVDGHAIEVRLYAEDPAKDFLPQTGMVHRWIAPTGPGIRLDAGIVEGGEVTSHYDPMIAKVIAHGRDRDEARRRLAAALDRTAALGVTTNRSFLARILRHEAFAGAPPTTAFLAEHDVAAEVVGARDVATLAGWWHLQRRDLAETRSPGLAGFSTTVWLAAHQDLAIGDDVHSVRIHEASRGVLSVQVGEDRFEIGRATDGTLLVDGARIDVAGHLAGATLHASLPQIDLVATDVLLLPAGGGDVGGEGVLLAPMHGAVTNVAAQVGAVVAKGDAVVVMEAMKMEHVVRADVDGTVTEVASVGAQVGGGDVVARITAAADEAT